MTIKEFFNNNGKIFIHRLMDSYLPVNAKNYQESEHNLIIDITSLDPGICDYDNESQEYAEKPEDYLVEYRNPTGKLVSKNFHNFETVESYINNLTINQM